MGVLIELVLVLVVLVAIGMVLFRSARRAPLPAERDPRRPQQVPPPVRPTRRGPWSARYELDGETTIWVIVRTVGDDRGEREEMHEIVRIDSAAPDFEERFVAGERKAHERALLLNSSLSP